VCRRSDCTARHMNSMRLHCSLDGVHVLFRVALAMIKLHEKLLLSIVDESEMLEAIKAIPSKCADTRVRALASARCLKLRAAERPDHYAQWLCVL
jgi:hypothetical protein